MQVALRGVVGCMVLLLLCHQTPPASSNSHQSQQLCNKWEANCRKRSIYCREAESPPPSPPVVWDGCCSLENVSDACSGVYTLRGLAGTFSTMQAYCEVNNSRGHAWTLIQKRTNGSLSFDKTWREYEEGFGNLEDEFWLGLKALHLLTSTGEWKLRIDMVELEPITEEPILTSVEYNHFQVAGPEQNYKLNASEFNTSTTYNILMGFHGNPFSTHDRDNDGWADNCARWNKGGWWYTPECFHEQGLVLNKEYNGGLKWHKSFAQDVQVISTEMKIRPSTCGSTSV